METRTTLKGYFETGDKPTQAQFASLIESSSNLIDDNITNPLLTETTPAVINTTTYDAFGITGRFLNKTLFIIYRQGTKHVGTGDFGIIKMRTSTNGGKTWSDSTTILSETNVDLRNIAGGVTSTGRLIVFYLRYNPDASTCYSNSYMYSDDNGLTWSDSVEISHGLHTFYSFYGSLQNIGDGKIMIHWYGDEDTNYESNINISDDNGATWGSTINVLTSTTIRYTESSFIYCGGGEIIGLARIDNGTTYRQAKSIDNGATWSDDGYVTFDSWTTYPSPPWLCSYKDNSGRLKIITYYFKRESSVLRAIVGTAKDLISSGVSGWNILTLRNIATSTTFASGYPSAVHPNNSPYGIGWWYDQITPTDADINFFIFSPTEIFIPTILTTTQRDAISPAIEGMVIYNSTTKVLNFHNGTAWGAV